MTDLIDPNLPPYMNFIRANYGANQYDIQDNPLSATVGTTPVRILSQNPNRVSLKIINLSVLSVYVWTTPDVSLTKGILLAANGGTLVMSIRSDDSLDLISEWWGQANSTVNIMAREIYKVA